MIIPQIAWFSFLLCLMMPSVQAFNIEEEFFQKLASLGLVGFIIVELVVIVLVVVISVSITVCVMRQRRAQFLDMPYPQESYQTPKRRVERTDSAPTSPDY